MRERYRVASLTGRTCFTVQSITISISISRAVACAVSQRLGTVQTRSFKVKIGFSTC